MHREIVIDLSQKTHHVKTGDIFIHHDLLKPHLPESGETKATIRVEAKLNPSGAGTRYRATSLTVLNVESTGSTDRQEKRGQVDAVIRFDVNEEKSNLLGRLTSDGKLVVLADHCALKLVKEQPQGGYFKVTCFVSPCSFRGIEWRLIRIFKIQRITSEEYVSTFAPPPQEMPDPEKLERFRNHRVTVCVNVVAGEIPNPVDDFAEGTIENTNDRVYFGRGCCSAKIILQLREGQNYIDVETDKAIAIKTKTFIIYFACENAIVPNTNGTYVRREQ